MDKKKHILLIPFPAYGHIIPITELGKKIAEFHYVSLAITAHMVPGIIQRGLNEQSINIIPIEDGYKIDPNEFALSNKEFKRLLDHMIPAYHDFMQKLPTKFDSGQEPYQILKAVDAIISDNFMVTMIISCLDRQIPFYHFNTTSAGKHQYCKFITFLQFFSRRCR